MDKRQKAMKCLISLLICCVMLLGMMPTVSHAADEGTTFYQVTSLAQLPKNANVVIVAEDNGQYYALTFDPSQTDYNGAATRLDSSAFDMTKKTLQVPSLDEKYVLTQTRTSPALDYLQFAVGDARLFLGTGKTNLLPIFQTEGSGSYRVYVGGVNEEGGLLTDGKIGENGHVKLWRGNTTPGSGYGLVYDSANGRFDAKSGTASVITLWSTVKPENSDDGDDDDDNPSRSDAPIYGKYVRVRELGNLADFDENTSFIVVINVDTGDGNGTRPYAISTNNYVFDVDEYVDEYGNTWKTKTVSGLHPVDTHSGEYIEVTRDNPNSITSYVLYVAYSNGFFVYNQLNQTPSMYAPGGIMQGSRFFAPQGGDSQSIGAFRRGASDMRFMSGTGKTDTFYMRSNGESNYLGYNQTKGIHHVPSSGDPDKQEVEIYMLTEVDNGDGTPPTSEYKKVTYHGRGGNDDIYTVVYVKNGITMADSAKENTFWDMLDGERVQYTFIGWSDKMHAPLGWEDSANLYDYIPGKGDNAIRDDVLKERTGITIYGDCNDYTPDIVSKADLPTDLYPVYIIRGVDTVAAANEGMAPAPHIGLTKYDIVGISRNETDDDLATEENYKWLGSITVEIYLDGAKWGESEEMYFKYHNDNSVDVNIKFLDKKTAEQYGQPNYKETLLAFMGNGSSNMDFPETDHTNQFVLDAVWVYQGQGEDGLKYEYNWLTNHGGQLDNIMGGSTIKLYVSSKYEYKYYLDGVLIQDDGWTVKKGEGPYTTIETYNRFVQHAYEGDGCDFWVEQGHANGYDVLMRQNNTGVFPYTAGRGQYERFCYFINDYAHQFDMAKEPAVQAPKELISTKWEFRDQNAVRGYWAWEDTFKVTADNKIYAYKSDEKDVPSYHFYAYTAVGLAVTKMVSGDGAETDRAFHFVVTLSGTYNDENNVTRNASQIVGTYGDMNFVNGRAEITLKHGETKLATRLPSGVTYTVTEVEANQDGYATTASGNTGTITANGITTAVFINSKVPDVPQTGDNSRLGLWLALMLASLVGMTAMVTVRRREKE